MIHYTHRDGQPVLLVHGVPHTSKSLARAAYTHAIARYVALEHDDQDRAASLTEMLLALRLALREFEATGC